MSVNIGTHYESECRERFNENLRCWRRLSWVDCVESRVNLIVLGVKRQGCFRSGLNRLVLEMVTIVLNVVRLAHFGDRKEKLV
jgi:hypothetical protein